MLSADDVQSEDLEEARAAHEAAAADARELHCANAALGGKACTRLLAHLHAHLLRALPHVKHVKMDT